MLKKLTSRQIGAIILGISLLMIFSFLLYSESLRSSKERACHLACGGECESETCPMNEPVYEKVAYYFSSSFIIILMGLGLYLLFSKPEKLVFGEETKFDVVLSVLNENEKKVLKAVKEQEGIKQSTLKYRVGFSKSKLSNLLKDLEMRRLIHRKEAGKTYKVFLKSSF